jgi:hypothetical protein
MVTATTRWARNYGYQDGLQDGANDRASNRGFRATKDDNYKHGDHGYYHGFGDKNQYKNMYRQAYEQGYQRGFNSGGGYYGNGRQRSGWPWGR